MTPIEKEWLFLIKRASKEGNSKLEKELQAGYKKWQERVTAPSSGVQEEALAVL